MKWITLLLQLVTFRSSLLESRALVENAKAVAEKGRRAALFSGFCLLAAVYFLAGTILAVVELGLQAENGEALHWSGLLGSSLALVILAVLVVAGAYLAFRSPKAPPPPPPKPESEVKAALENFVLTFLAKLADKLKDGKPEKDESRA
jgi:hypothetical protein